MMDSDKQTTEQKNKEQQESVVSEIDELDEQFRSVAHEDNPNMERQKINDFLYRRKDMETYLWYGCLLAYYYPKEDARSIMGKNLVIAISSVYYDILSSLDDESQHAFKQYQNKLYQIDSD